MTAEYKSGFQHNWRAVVCILWELWVEWTTLWRHRTLYETSRTSHGRETWRLEGHGDETFVKWLITCLHLNQLLWWYFNVEIIEVVCPNHVINALPKEIKQSINEVSTVKLTKICTFFDNFMISSWFSRTRLMRMYYQIIWYFPKQWHTSATIWEQP